MSGLDIPDTVNAADVQSWSDEVDVLVIGFGIAGGCAAVSAAAAGANVMVLEKAAAAGGTPVVQQGIMPGGMKFAYLSAADAGAPYIEIAVIPDEIRSFFDYVKQEQQ